MDRRFTRRSFLATTGAVALAGCLGGDGGTTPTDTDDGTPGSGGGDTAGGTPGAATTGRTAAGNTVATATDRAGAEQIPPPLADRVLPLPMSGDDLQKKAVSGGPPKDGIPSIDDPKFESAKAADDRLASNDVVFGVKRNGVAKAYPQHVLVWHEICNDTIGGEKVSVTYCPLTGTVLGFKRGDTTFGVSGRLVNNNLIMYDRAGERWWPQVLATAIASPWYEGLYEQVSLREFRLVWTTWEDWKAVHPDTKVLTRETGYVRNYGSDPYGDYNPPAKSGYYRNTAAPMFPALNQDDRFAPKQVVMGARTPKGAVAFLKDALRTEKLMKGSIGDLPVLAVYDPRLDTGYVYRNPDGASFSFEGGEAVAADGTAHAPDALPLDRIHTFDAMWFAWHGFYPQTGVYGGE